MQTKFLAIADRVSPESGLTFGPQAILNPKFRASEPPEFTGRFHVLHEIFEAQADARPNAAAVVFAGANTTYAALERGPIVRAGCFRARGVRCGDIIARLDALTADEGKNASRPHRVDGHSSSVAKGLR